MKISKARFVKFLERVTPLQSINEAVFNFTEEGIKVVSADTQSKSFVANVFLPKEIFEEYEAIGEVGIRAISTIIKMVSSLSGDILLFQKNNQFITFYNESKTKEIKCILPDLNTIGRVPTLKEFSFPIKLSLTNFSDFSKIKKNFMSVGSDKFTMTFSGENLTVVTSSVSGDFSIKEELVFSGNTFPETVVNMGKNLLPVLDKIDDEALVTLYTGNKLPMKIEIEDFMKTTYLLSTVG